MNKACCISCFCLRGSKEYYSTHVVWEPRLFHRSTDLCLCTITPPVHSTSLALLSTKFHSSQPCGPYHSLISVLLGIEYWQRVPVLENALKERLLSFHACHHSKLLSLIYKLWKRNHFHYLLCKSKWISKTSKSSSPAWLPKYSPHSVACHSLSCDIFPFP